ncbi:MAG: hypothetical protein RR853_09170 [Aurantimicrobium sp.]|uniref:hypothetical protein n=1 Tax=Aurantimicrobium sp. TaxID=1930784 RepID=UPI002FC7066B
MKSHYIPKQYPHVVADRAELSPGEYDHMCDVWARSLTESNLRSLASDCMRTPEDQRTDDMMDALREFKRREAAGLLSDSDKSKTPVKSLKTRNKRTR